MYKVLFVSNTHRRAFLAQSPKKLENFDVTCLGSTVHSIHRISEFLGEVEGITERRMGRRKVFVLQVL